MRQRQRAPKPPAPWPVQPDYLYTVSEIADRWNCSRDKMISRFAPLVGRGVFDLNAGRMPTKSHRTYRELRIPGAVLLQVMTGQPKPALAIAQADMRRRNARDRIRLEQLREERRQRRKVVAA